jgi:hypothetical protein
MFKKLRLLCKPVLEPADENIYKSKKNGTMWFKKSESWARAGRRRRTLCGALAQASPS